MLINSDYYSMSVEEIKANVFCASSIADWRTPKLRFAVLKTSVLPQEAVNVFQPLAYEVVCDWFCVVGKAEILQSVEEQRRAVVQCSNGHLEAHSPQLAGLHLPRQTLQCSRHKQRHNLQGQDEG